MFLLTCSGGTYLRFIGTLLDVVEDPMMIVYVINTTSNLTVESYLEVRKGYTLAILCINIFDNIRSLAWQLMRNN